MKGDFSRPPLWSMAYGGQIYPYPNSLLAQQGQPITDWMFNMSLRLIQSDIEELRHATNGETLPQPVLNADDTATQAGTHVVVRGAHVRVPPGTIPFKVVAPNLPLIDLDIIHDTVDLSQLPDVPDHAMLGAHPLAHFYVGFIRNGNRPVPTKTDATVTVLDRSYSGDTLRLEVDAISKEWPNTDTSSMTIRWARNNAASAVLLIPKDIDSGAFTVSPLSPMTSSDLINRWGLLELRSKDEWLLDPYTDLSANPIVVESAGLLRIDVRDLTSAQKTSIKNNQTSCWLRIWDGKKEIKKSDSGKNNEFGPFNIKWGAPPTDISYGDSWLIFVRPDPLPGGSGETKPVFRNRHECRVPLKYDGARWSRVAANVSHGAQQFVHHVQPNVPPRGPSKAHEAYSNEVNPLRSLRIRDAAPDTLSAPLRHWLSSVTMDEVASTSIDSLRAKILRSISLKDSERAEFDAELTKVHASAVQCARNLMRTGNQALA